MSSFALSANTRKQIKFVDENGAIRTDVTSVTIFTVDTETAASLYTTTTTTTAITNPMTTSSTNTGINTGQGEAVFWSVANTFDMNVTVGGTTFKFFDVATTDKQFTILRVQSPGRTVMDLPTDAIWVATTGSNTSGNGSFGNPYATIVYAFTKITTARKTILVMPGEYAEVHTVYWPSITGVILKAPFKDVVVSNVGVVSSVIWIEPVYTASTFEAALDGIEVDGGSGYDGVVIDNQYMTKKLNVYMNNYTFSGDVDQKSIKVSHTSADNAIRVYVDGGGETWEGIATFVFANTGDRLRIKNTVLLGGITTTGAVAGEVFLQNTGILTGAITNDGANKLTTVGCWYQTDADPTVYTNCANAFATYP